MELQSNYGRITIELQLIYNQTMVKLQIALWDNYIMLQRNYDYVTLRHGNFLLMHTICVCICVCRLSPEPIMSFGGLFTVCEAV